MDLLKKIFHSLHPSKESRYKIKSTVTNKEFESLKSNLLSPKEDSKPLQITDQHIIERIQKETKEWNLNNITRTKAYLDFYKRHKEIHWSFLAHMVSRNGGWNMTDLKGSLISPFIPDGQSNTFFEFLEKANALIFHDVYPQLLLYEHSKKVKKPLFHLLPHFSVSAFMTPIWDFFWTSQNSQLLTIALIINEQNYIQTRLIENSYYKKEVLNTILFKGQERLGFTDVLFPYKRKNMELAGVTVHDFEDVDARIETGKKLYGILFHSILKPAFSFAELTPHSGSRADFWPDIFTTVSTNEHLFYSPTLEQTWPNFTHTFKDFPDWFTSNKMIVQLKEYYIPYSYKLTKDYKSDLEHLEVLKNLKEIVT
ncbi:DUF2515 family protein [Bacillus sp. AK128]